MKRSIFLILSLLSASIFNLEAERYYFFDHVTTTDGLPSNTIYCTMQDRAGFMWIGTRDGLTRYDGNHFHDMRDICDSDNIGGNTFAICEDIDGQIWFSTPSGVHIYCPYTGEIQSLEFIGDSSVFTIEADLKGRVWLISDSLYRIDCKNLEKSAYTFEGAYPSSIAVDSYGSVWVSTADGILYIYDARTDTFVQRECGYVIKEMVPAEDGRLIIATDRHEVLYLDCITLNSESVFKAEKGTNVRKLIESQKGECWIGTNNGLYIRRSGSDYHGQAFHDDATPESISANYITSLGKDRNGNIWAGTYYTGLNIWKNRGEEMSIYFQNPSDNTIKGKIVRAICQDSRGYIWFCTEDGWLNRFNPTDHSIKNYMLADDLNLQGLVIDGDRMWVCSYGKGLWLFDLRQDKLIKHYDLPNNTTTLGIKARNGRVYIGTTTGLYRYDHSDDTFTLVECIGRDFVHSIYQDTEGVIWIGTYGNGVWCMTEGEEILNHFTVSDTAGGLTSRFITSFFEDTRHRMWITTEGGGVCYTEPEYDIRNISFNNLSTKDGLPSNVTCAIAEDADGMIWMSTTNGIICLSEKDFKITGLINESNEFTGYQFSYGAVCTSQNGMFYFGNTDGMVSLAPSKLKNDSNKDVLVITDIQARNSESSFPLKEPGKSSVASKHVQVKHKNATSILISFVVPEYSSRKPLYTYNISRGRSSGFSGATYENNVIFTGLRAGKYRFEVSVAGNEGIPELKRTLNIDILPHPLLSTAAFLIYSFLGLAIIVAFIIMLEMKRRRDKARQYSKMVNKKEKEIYNAKINFFTNITHEIRTPLTLIKMPIDKIISSGAYNSSNEQDLRTIQANTDRLLNLTNQILDMRKMERNEIRMSFVKEDLCSIVKKAQRLFDQIAHEQGINIVTDMPDTPIHIMCAKDSILTIVSNLISNAIKYGNGLINIKVHLSDDSQTAIVRVENNGEIIPVNDRENIFKIFFQREGAEKGSQGTGLGLPYARTLANTHNGRLYFDDSIESMNSFVLEVPVNQTDQITIEQPESEKTYDAELPEFDSSRHTVVIVEDAADMRNYLAKELSAEFNILTAANGEIALEIARKEKVDLIISDIMMPIMDGYELCDKIKKDTDLSHIPVILLTAAVGVETRIETLESGADGYIEKPFPMELLMSNINNLFRNKEISYQQFISKPLTHYNSVTASKVDQEYMDKIHDFIMKHISETDLNIENLTMQIGTSKSSLYRKLKANTGLSINEYIRLCRLKQAAELLSSQKYKINEVAFMTGFSSPSYFATCFLKQFNITPSEFVKNLGQ